MRGSTAAGLHYNVFSRLITDICAQLLRIPLLFYFGDLSSLSPRLLVSKALAVFADFCPLLGVELKEPNAEAGP